MFRFPLRPPSGSTLRSDGVISKSGVSRSLEIGRGATRPSRHAAVSTLLSQPAFANGVTAPRTAIAGSEADEALIEALEDLANRTRCRAAA
jgi:hypothetical protein